MNKSAKTALWIVGIIVIVWAIWYFTKPKQQQSTGAIPAPPLSTPVPSQPVNNNTGA